MMARFTVLASLVLLTGCGPSEDMREVARMFLRQCDETSLRYDIGQESGTRALLIQCEEKKMSQPKQPHFSIAAAQAFDDAFVDALVNKFSVPRDIADQWLEDWTESATTDDPSAPLQAAHEYFMKRCHELPPGGTR